MHGETLAAKNAAMSESRSLRVGQTLTIFSNPNRRIGDHPMNEVTTLETTQREAVKSAVLAAAAAPQKLAALKKAAKEAVAVKKDKQLAEAVVDEMVAAGELHNHGTTAKALYGKDKPIDPNDPEKVNAALLAAAATPQKLAKLVKAAVKATKADESFVEGQANTLIANQQLHKHGSGDKALLSRDNPNDPEKVNKALLDAAVTPHKLAKLVKAVVKETKSTEEFVTDRVNKLVEAQQLHKHGSGEKVTYGKDKPVDPNDPEKVNKALLDAADTPKKFAKLVKAAVKATKADESFVEGQANTLIANQQLHKHGSGDKALLSRDNPNDPEKVNKALLDAAATPQKLPKLVKAVVKETKSTEEFVTNQANQLIASEQLHKHGTAKTPHYGREKRKLPHPFEVAPGKKAYEALVKAARKVQEAAPAVSLDEVLKLLRESLSEPVAEPEVVPPPVAPHVADPVVPPKPKPHEPPPTPELRAVLKAAYDELCLDVEFQHKMVELRRLYHEACRTLPALTVAQFHHELESLQKDHVLELHALNEVQHAKEPELALHRGDRLLYYVMWR
jgi:hypothetical protein